MLSDEFTHYDLHADNVILYQVGGETQVVGEPQQYITMNYHYPNGDVVTFNTYAIAKIIDYGRSYFKENETYNSSTYYQKLRESIKNAPDTEYPGKEKGKCANESYGILEDETTPGSFHYISSNKRNKSHDLRLAAYIAQFRDDNYLGTPVEYDLRIILACIKYEGIFGTKEVAESSYPGLGRLKSGESICNVEDMHLALKDLIMTTPHFKKMNRAISTSEKYKKIGEMHVWMDGSRSLQYTAEGGVPE
jgi:hypothetical protein